MISSRRKPVPSHLSHLTTRQFSAFLDQQLAAPEQSTCQTHLNTCASCQHQLIELQQTVLLVRALPQAPLPRSFMLSAEVLAGEKADAPLNLVRQAHNRIIVFPSYIHSTMRIASTLVATLGLFFMLSGALAIELPIAEMPLVSTPFAIHVKVKEPSSSSSNPSFTSRPAPLTPPARLSDVPVTTGDFAISARLSDVPVTTGRSVKTYQPNSSPNTSQQQPLLSLVRPFFNVDTLQGHLSIGLLLFIVGMMSVMYYSLHSRKKRSEDDFCNR